MRTRHLTRLLAAGSACALIAACGGSTGNAVTDSAPTIGAQAIPSPARIAATAALRQWPEFGLNPQRSDASERATGITAADVAHLRRLRVTLPGTVDSSPIYLHAARVQGAVHQTILVTTTYGRTLAIDAADGRLLWTFTPPGYARWAGTAQITNAFPSLTLRQAFTPTNQEQLNSSDTDLGSSAPALLGANRVLVAGKDGIMRVLELSRLNGRSSASHARLGGELQRLPLPGGGELFSAPAVWRHGERTTVFIGDEHATAAYVLRRGRLYPAWQNDTPGTSPVMAGGLLYVYNPAAGGIDVYRPASPHPIATLPGLPGHWNSPIVIDGHVVEPEGDANDHNDTSGTLDIFSTRQRTDGLLERRTRAT